MEDGINIIPPEDMDYDEYVVVVKRNGSEEVYSSLDEVPITVSVEGTTLKIEVDARE